ncbi:hypothetical protein CWI37_0091p0060 [Hamiltosporidium tvaerminnensis]|uniref:Reverse transcriptase n=1 Tax=Hamiltosporidium tvaerminnensis TaxID=1176355 RepID=A0A4Q9LBP8_9MICR|nr:hypothetical protein CWI37_0091p0060 [Hamiltosporidium tvaerminnensis]
MIILEYKMKWIKTDVKIRNNRPDIFILDKKKNKITLIEVGITSQDSLQIVKTEKLRKYDPLANELGLIYRCSVEIIPYVMTWDGIVTKYHKSHLKRLEIPMNVEAYIHFSHHAGSRNDLVEGPDNKNKRRVGFEKDNEVFKMMERII